MDKLLCDHLSNLFSEKVRQRDINSFVAMMRIKHRAGNYVDACKSLSQGLKQFLSGNPDGFQSTSKFFQMKRFKWEPISDLGPNAQEVKIPNSTFIEKVLYYCSRHPQDANKLLSGMMKMHTALASPKKPSQSAISKVRDVITSPGPDIDDRIMFDMIDLSDRFVKLFVERYGFIEREYMTLASMPANPNKNSYSLVSAKSVSRDRSELYHLGALIDHELVRPIIERYPNESIHALISAGEADGQFLTDNRPTHGGPIGSISMIPERANKYRTVAVPSVGLLSMSYPLSRILHRIIRKVPTQGVSSHDDTTRYLSNLIDGETTFHSMDMSNFTDRFPYKIQRVLLESMILHGLILPYDLDVQDVVCSGSYDFRKDPIIYKVGTPQGTYPSFPLASLSHGLIAAISYERAHGTEVNLLDDLPFRIIGDDIVIYDDPTYEEYIKIMTSLGVEVSLEKTMNSKTHIEMCSKWISHGEVNFQKKIKPIETEGAYIKAYLYYEGRIQVIPEFEYVHYLPYPFGVLEADEEDVIIRISNFASELRSLNSIGMTKKDYIILSNRHAYHDLYILGDRKESPPKAYFTPLEESLLRDARIKLDILDQSESEQEMLQILAESDDIVKYVSDLSARSSYQVESGPGVPITTSISAFARDRDRAKELGLQRLQASPPNNIERTADDEEGNSYSYSL